MPRERIDIEPYKDNILSLISSYQWSHVQIREHLYNNYNIRVGRSTLQKRLNEWNPPIIRNTTKRVHIQERVAQLLPRFNTQDILDILSSEGTPTSKRTLKRVRNDLNIKLRLSPEERELQMIEVEAILIIENEIGESEDFGRRIRYRELRAIGFFYTEAQVEEVYRRIRPDGVQRRLPGTRRERINYISPGPNDVWHIDGHMKLEPFGIEIYAAIDGYSRYIVWVFVGVSARTAVSVLKQYLDALRDNQHIQPVKIRSDRGTETVLLADTQYAIRRKEDPSLTPEDCYIYGKSVSNQRIEAWWGMLSRASTRLFHEYFHNLANARLFTKDVVPEQVCILAIYMPIIRNRVHAYTEYWNSHPIQKDSRRPHIVPGKPCMNYHLPKVPNLGCKINQDPTSEQNMLLQELRQETQQWDSDEYLPAHTLAWCQQQLNEIGIQMCGEPFDPTNPTVSLIGTPRAPYQAVYERLREKALAHWRSCQAPRLELCTKPVGAFDWRPT